MNQPSFLEKIAQLLHERIQLGENRLPVQKEFKQDWYNEFKAVWLYRDQDGVLTASSRDSGSYYLLVKRWTHIWDKYGEFAVGEQRLYALDAFFDFMDDELREAEKTNAGKRVLFTTKWGTLVLGGRPLLAGMPDEEVRIPMNADRLFRHVYLLPNSSIDYEQTVIDGGQYQTSTYKLSRSDISVGLAALSGIALTHFEAVGQLMDAGSQPQIVIKSARIQPAKLYEQELRNCIDWAVKQGIYILCIPELSVCSNGRQILKAQIKEHGLAGRLKNLTLVIAGSYHTNDYNEAPIWLVDPDGDISELVYRKHEAFSTPMESKEPAYPGLKNVKKYARKHNLLRGKYYNIRENIIANKDILLLQLPIGLVGVLICKDFLSPHYYAAYDAIEPDFLLIISMNWKGGEFAHRWRKEVRRHTLSAGFYVNATQVVASTDSQTEVIFWGLPYHSPGTSGEVYYRSVKNETISERQLPADGLVSISLPSSPFYYDTAPLNLIS